MSKTLAALLLVSQCRCKRCDYRWRESQLMFRTDSGYSYDYTPERAADMANGLIPVLGRRFTPRVTGACQNCVVGPNITVWEGSLKLDYAEPIPINRTAKKRNSLGQQTAIQNLLEMD